MFLSHLQSLAKNNRMYKYASLCSYRKIFESNSAQCNLYSCRGLYLREIPDNGSEYFIFLPEAAQMWNVAGFFVVMLPTKCTFNLGETWDIMGNNVTISDAGHDFPFPCILQSHLQQCKVSIKLYQIRSLSSLQKHLMPLHGKTILHEQMSNNLI